MEPTSDQSPVIPTGELDTLLARHGASFPPLPEELQKLLDPPPHASETLLRQAYEERRQLYAARTGGQLPKPVRQQNLALLSRLETVAPELERHIVGLKAWRLLAEAADFLAQRHAGRARNRLADAAVVLASLPESPSLSTWLRDLEADLLHAPQPEAPSAAPLPVEPNPPAPPPPSTPISPPPAPPAIAPLISSPLVAKVRAGETFEYAIASEPPADTYAVEGLPAGLALDPASGRISGAVAQAGHHLVQLCAHRDGRSSRATLVLAVEAPPPPPQILVASESAATAGQPFACAYIVWPPGTPVEARGLPAGLTHAADRSRIEGIPSAAGEARIELAAAGPGGRAVAELQLRIQVTPTSSLPSAPPAVAATDRFTLHLPDGRRLHVFAGPRVHLGRTAESDLPVTVCARGNAVATKSLIGEISRQHAEVFLENGLAGARDGWRETGQPSSFGTYLDGAKIAPAGAPLRDGQTLRFTARPPGPAVPHWKIRVFAAADLAAAPAALREPITSGIQAVWLRRQDELPDDMLLLPGLCDLRALGLSVDPLLLWRSGTGFLWAGADGTPAPLESVIRAIPGSRLGPPGAVQPHDMREALALSTKR